MKDFAATRSQSARAHAMIAATSEPRPDANR